MDAKTFKQLKDSVGASKKAVAELDKQIANMDKMFAGVIDNLDGEDRQKVQTLKGLVNRAIKKAEKGGDYNEVINTIKTTFKKDLQNGSKNNGQGL